MLKFDDSFVPEPMAKAGDLFYYLPSSTLIEKLSQPTGKESLVEKWILHKLNTAATEVNKYMEERNFMLTTTSAYNFWLYELCDVYIVSTSSYARLAYDLIAVMGL